MQTGLPSEEVTTLADNWTTCSLPSFRRATFSPTYPFPAIRAPTTSRTGPS